MFGEQTAVTSGTAKREGERQPRGPRTLLPWRHPKVNRRGYSGRRVMLHSRSVRRNLAASGAVALLGLVGLALGANPALAAGSGPTSLQSVGMHALQAPVANGGTLSGRRQATLDGGRILPGASSQTDMSEPIQSGATSWPALAAPSAPTMAGSEQASSSTTGAAYTALTPTRLLDTRATGTPLGPGGSLNLTVAGVDGVPGTATAVAINVTVTNTTAASYLSVYPAGGARPVVSNLNWASGETVPNLVIVPVGTSGQVSFYNYAGRTDVVVDLEGYFAPEAAGSTAGAYVPITPTRVIDTRTGSGLSSAGMTLGAGGSLSFTATAAGNGPSTGVTAVLMNVTVTNTTAASYLTAYPEGATQPLASNLNWVPRETVANRVVVPVSSTGRVTLYNSTGSTDVIVDVNGYFTNGSSTASNASLFTAITPVRVLDTRQTGGPLGAGTTITQQMSGADGISATASAVVTNVTAADTTAASYFTVYPGGIQPTASDVNWGAGQTVPNLTVATLSSSGSISIYNYAGSADVIVDAFGYFSPITATTTLVITTTSLPSATVGTAYSATLAASGGTAPYSWAVTSGALPSGLTLSLSGGITGTPSAAGTASFGVQATDSTTPTAETATAQLSISVASAATPTSATPTVYSGNWSGYVVGDGPYTAVAGTFNVPNLYAASTQTEAAEWVGINGVGLGTPLIQAGAVETYQPSTNLVYTQAWWEILPTDPTMVLIPGSSLYVVPGDQVTVTIEEVTATIWGITLTDNTTGQTFTTDQTYTDSLASAEWIVEAPTAQPAGTVDTLGDYAPAVTFSSLGVTGTQTALDDWIMVQNGVQVSTPSALTSSGFSVDYTGP